jgi:myosin heavy subunit
MYKLRMDTHTYMHAQIQTLLLEKSRVASGKDMGERNYHIFYQICSAPESERRDLKQSFRILGHGQASDGDVQRLGETYEALRYVYMLVARK